MSRFEIIDGLPSYGPAALPFPEDGRGAFREGFVIRFHPAACASWVGNFQRGISGGDWIVDRPDGQQVVVIAGGGGYVVDPETRRQTHEFGGGINFVQQVPPLNIVVIGNGTQLGVFSADGLSWTERISWDGMQNIAVSGTILHGEAWSPISNMWRPFELDLRTGKTVGSVYGEQMGGAVQISPPRL